MELLRGHRASKPLKAPHSAFFPALSCSSLPFLCVCVFGGKAANHQPPASTGNAQRCPAVAGTALQLREIGAYPVTKGSTGGLEEINPSAVPKLVWGPF